MNPKLTVRHNFRPARTRHATRRDHHPIRHLHLSPRWVAPFVPCKSRMQGHVHSEVCAGIDHGGGEGGPDPRRKVPDGASVIPRPPLPVGALCQQEKEPVPVAVRCPQSVPVVQRSEA